MSKQVKISFDKPKQVIGSFLKPKPTTKIINKSTDQVITSQATDSLETKTEDQKQATTTVKNIESNNIGVNNPLDFFKAKQKKQEHPASFSVDSGKSLLITSKPKEETTLSVDLREPTIIPIKKWNDFLQEPVYYVAMITALVSGALFFYTALQEKAASIGVPNIKLENLVIFTFLSLVILDIIFVYLIRKKFTQSVTQSLHVFFALITLQVSAFLYSLKIYGAELFTLGPVQVTTSAVIPLLAIIIFLQALDIIQNKNRMWVNIAQVFVILNQLFSTVKLFNENSFSKKNFSSSIFNTIFDFPPYIWVLFATIALAILSTYNLKQGYTRFIFVVGMMFPILNLLLYTRTSTYWYQTIMGLIVWDMIYTPMFEAENEHTDKNVMARLMVSSVYHLALFMLVLIFNTVLNFIIVKP
jgi:hypothetical protein